MILSYDAQAAATPGVGLIPTEIILIGDGIQQSGATVVNGTRRTKYYTMQDGVTLLPEGALTIFVKIVNFQQVAAGTLNMDISVWTDQDHMDAYTVDNKEVFFDRYVARLQELNPGFIRTGTTWTNTSTASPVEGTGCDPEIAPGQAWEPDWSKRTMPSSPRWSVAEGVPWEVHAWLANKLQCNLWVCIPFQDDPVLQELYVQGMAGCLRDELDPNLDIYVEYSNEMWNGGFTTNMYLECVHPNDLPAQRLLAAQLAEEAFRDWCDVWNDCQVNFVAMGKTGDLPWAETIANQLLAANLCDALGCTFYITPSLTNEMDWVSTNSCEPTTPQIFGDLLARIDDTSPAGLTGALQEHATLAANRGVEFFCYEGGPALVAAQTPCLANNYGVFQNTQEVADLVTHALDRFVDPASTAIAPTAAQAAYFAFCDQGDELNGDLLLVRDLWAGIVGEGEVFPDPQLKFLAVQAFIATH